MFFLSTARSRLGAYHIDSQGYVADYTVLFTLDGNKLSNTYRGEAVDYWQMNNDQGIPMKDEMEDRVFSYKRTMPSLRYIKQIDILLDSETSYSRKQASLLYFINLCKRKGFDVRVFDSRRSFIVGRDPVATGEGIKDRQETSGFTGYSDNNRRYKSSKPSELAQIVATFQYLRRGKLPPREYSEILVGSYGYSRDYYKQEVVKKIMNDMHNNTRAPIMQEVADIMRFYRTNRISVVLDELLARYREIEG